MKEALLHCIERAVCSAIKSTSGDRSLHVKLQKVKQLIIRMFLEDDERNLHLPNSFQLIDETTVNGIRHLLKTGGRDFINISGAYTCKTCGKDCTGNIYRTFELYESDGEIKLRVKGFHCGNHDTLSNS